MRKISFLFLALLTGCYSIGVHQGRRAARREFERRLVFPGYGYGYAYGYEIESFRLSFNKILKKIKKESANEFSK